MNKGRLSNKKVYFILAIIILAGIIWFSYGFFVEKQGTHSDEEWSFGLANSYYEPFICYSDNIKYEVDNIYYKNTSEWISGEVLFDALSVQEDERFSFDSVYYNQSCDVHPPLYYYILHFLSSFFVDQYIPALAFFINIISFIIMSIYLYKLMLLISKSRFAGVACVLFNTFTFGTLEMMVFMRMYTMLAMFAVVFAYLTAKVYYNKDCRKKLSTYIVFTIVTLLGAMTHHYFLPYAFIITALMCIYWIVKKDFKVFLKYAISILFGVALSIILFPATLDHMFGIRTNTFNEYNNDTYKMIEIPADAQDTEDSFDITENIDHYQWRAFKYYFALSFQLMFTEEIGWSPIIPYSRGILINTPVALIILAILFTALNFLFRNEIWYKNLKIKTKTSIKKIPTRAKGIFKHFNCFLFSLFISIIFIFLILIFWGGRNRSGICEYG